MGQLRAHVGGQVPTHGRDSGTQMQRPKEGQGDVAKDPGHSLRPQADPRQEVELHKVGDSE